MVYRFALRLMLCLCAASVIVPPLVSKAAAFDGSADPDDLPPLRGYQAIPGVPTLKIQPGVHFFGPDGQILPDSGDDSHKADRLDNLPRRSDHPKKELTEAEKAEALRKALAPKPSAAVVRQQTLDELFKQLADANDEESAKVISGTIEHIWGHSDSDTANLLMERGSASLAAGHYPLALSIFDKLVALKPQWAEAWNKRATTRYRAGDFEGAMADIDQVLKLEPRHYGALAGMGLILQKSNLDKQALAVFRKALALNPKQTELHQLIENLSLEVEGRDI
jgi:tetratricopeptide (TPR) repeat protein